MKLTLLLGLLAAGLPAHGADAAPRPEPAPSVPQVQVTTRIVVVDRTALTRAGLEYVVLGSDRVRVSSRRDARGRGIGVGVGTHGIEAFVAAARRSRLVQSESTQQVLTLSGREARVSSADLAVRGHAARTRGPWLVVTPLALPDGRVQLRVSAGVEDAVRYGWGYGADGSPAAVDAEIVADDGEEVLVASSASVERSRETGLLSWESGERGRDVLVLVSARVTRR